MPKVLIIDLVKLILLSHISSTRCFSEEFIAPFSKGYIILILCVDN